MDFELFTNILFATLRTGTPLILIALGEMVCEKSGVLNLGQEGMVLMGAALGFIAAVVTGHAGLGIIAAILAGMMMSVLFAFLAVTLVSNQVATGLALTIFGTGLSGFLGAGYVGMAIDGIAPFTIPLLSDIPFIGKVLFSHDPLVYLSWVMFALIFWCFRSTRLGLTIRAVGENPEAANAIGIPVMKVRYGAILFGGAMAGLAGAYLSLVYTPMWSEGMSAGRGWIALALVVFASWKPWRVLLGAWLFGGVTFLQLYLQAAGLDVPVEYLSMSPYVITIVVLVIMSADKNKAAMNAPASLGKIFHATH